jgi:ketosteroid isomerase-like protein
MSDRDDFVAWTQSRLRDAETALHNGDPGPRLAIWSTQEPVSVLGAWRSAIGQEAVRDLFHDLARTFSDCTSHVYEIVAADVVGDMAVTAGYERTQASVNGEPRRYVLRVTQVYRREAGDWKVVHRHADTAQAEEAGTEAASVSAGAPRDRNAGPARDGPLLVEPRTPSLRERSASLGRSRPT